jgi:UDP-N-acetylmuramoyl-tripeptide--D-alanyl-D-alanine ligase
MSIEQLYSFFQHHPSISTDTRRIIPGSIFFALHGDHFDGNLFAQQALDAGASLSVVSDPSLAGDQFFYVPDTLAALQALAKHHRKQLTIPVIGITGTNGKTTTKELITRVLATRYKVHATQGNLNNHIGVPLTILSTPINAEILVCEMGANHIGEIAQLCTIANPTLGLITNIGKAHLEGFGSFDGVKKAKGELYQHVAEHGGLLFVNIDDASLAAWIPMLEHKITYGLRDEHQPDIHFSFFSGGTEQGFAIQDRRSDYTIHSSMFGQYNASNILAAYTVATYFEVPKAQIAEAIAAYIPGNNRSQVLTHRDCTIIKDAYNANPSSMELAIQAFNNQFPGGILVLGDMKELGDSSQQAHAHIIALAKETNASLIYLVGPEFAKALAGNDSNRVYWYPQIDALREDWEWSECIGKTILIKGSRSMRLEELLT